MDEALTRQKLKQLRAMVADSDRVAILLQDDPDPDAMSSAMALRALLKRNKLTTPIFSFASVTRPENRAMMRLLDIEVLRVTTEQLDEFEKVALLDVQPPYFEDRLKRADIVIDHHPGYAQSDAPFEDVRTNYGATATIMTEYLTCAHERISERLATALMYGIRSDTLMLSRRVTDEDVQAFVRLYPLVNYNLLGRIDRPEFPLSFAGTLARAIARITAHDGLVVINLGKVERDDLIVQTADFCLQFEGVHWVAVAGKLGENLVISVRNHGDPGQDAGEVVRRLFGEIGSAGGHRNMSKAVIALKTWRRQLGSLRDGAIETRLREMFAAEVRKRADEGEPGPAAVAS